MSLKCFLMLYLGWCPWHEVIFCSSKNPPLLIMSMKCLRAWNPEYCFGSYHIKKLVSAFVDDVIWIAFLLFKESGGWIILYTTFWKLSRLILWWCFLRLFESNCHFFVRSLQIFGKWTAWYHLSETLFLATCFRSLLKRILLCPTSFLNQSHCLYICIFTLYCSCIGLFLQSQGRDCCSIYDVLSFCNIRPIAWIHCSDESQFNCSQCFNHTRSVDLSLATSCVVDEGLWYCNLCSFAV